MRKTAKRQKITLVEIAKLAGVSVATASRVARGQSGVRLELRQRVLDAASRLRVNLGDRNGSRIVAFLLCNREVLHPFHSSVLVGSEAFCATQDYGLLFLPLQYAPSAPWRSLHIPAILGRRDIIRGVIAAGTTSQNLLDLLAESGTPFVVLGNNFIGPPAEGQYNTVYFDDIGGAHEATRYLQSLGHRDIWYVGNYRLPWFARREKGYRQAMTEAGLPSHALDVDSDDPEDLGYVAAKSVLKKGESASAFLAGDDAVARGVYKALQESGIRVHEDVSVVGFNDTLEARALTPPLTTVRVFTELLGRKMAELLVRQIVEPATSPETLTIPTQLVKRESCRHFTAAMPRGGERAAEGPSETESSREAGDDN